MPPPAASRRSCCCRAGRCRRRSSCSPSPTVRLVLTLDTDFDGCMAIVQRLSQDEGIYLANSMNSLRLEGQEDGGHRDRAAARLADPGRRHHPRRQPGKRERTRRRVRDDGDARASSTSSRRSWSRRRRRRTHSIWPTSMTGSSSRSLRSRPRRRAIQIGNPVSVRKAIRTLQRHRGIVEQASEAELAEAAARADRTGMYNCPHTGVALAVLIKLRERGLIDASDRVVVISTANGLKFTDFKLGYHESRAARHHAAARQHAHQAAERLRRGAAHHRRTRCARVLTHT